MTAHEEVQEQARLSRVAALVSLLNDWRRRHGFMRKEPEPGPDEPAKDWRDGVKEDEMEPPPF